MCVIDSKNINIYTLTDYRDGLAKYAQVTHSMSRTFSLTRMRLLDDVLLHDKVQQRLHRRAN